VLLRSNLSSILCMYYCCTHRCNRDRPAGGDDDFVGTESSHISYRTAFVSLTVGGTRMPREIANDIANQIYRFTGVALPMHRPGSTATAVGPKNPDVEGSVNGAWNAWSDMYIRIWGGNKVKSEQRQRETIGFCVPSLSR
jgi:hypothetical protein